MSAMKALRDKNADLADLEKILNPTDVKSSVMPRWQRKALQRSDSSTSNDRFIPTRSAIDFDQAGHVMSSSENSSSSEGESDESKEARQVLAALTPKVEQFREELREQNVEDADILRVRTGNTAWVIRLRGADSERPSVSAVNR